MKIDINIDWKRTLLVTVDVIIACYLAMVFISWHKPVSSGRTCTKVQIDIADENENGFLKSDDVKALLEKHKLFPLSKSIRSISTRDIEQQLMQMPFVKTAQCYITQEGHAHVIITQRTPVVRVKAESGDDYYIDDNGGVMPNSQYTSDMIIVTGNINRQYAVHYIYHLAKRLMDDDLWRNQIEQINVLPDSTIELVPRVGEHIINIGSLPQADTQNKRKTLIDEYVDKQMQRLRLFYEYGLCHSGWKKYEYISLEFCNQIVCRRRSQQPESQSDGNTASGSSDKEGTKPVQGNNDSKQKQDDNKENI